MTGWRVIPAGSTAISSGLTSCNTVLTLHQTRPNASKSGDIKQYII